SCFPSLTSRLSRATRFPYPTLFRSAYKDDSVKVRWTGIGQESRTVAGLNFPFYLFQQLWKCHRIGLPRIDPTPVPSGHHLDLCRSEEHTSELQSRVDLVCRLLLEKN